MAKNTYKSNSFKKKPKRAGRKTPAFWKDRRFRLALGFFLLGLSFFLFTAFISYLFTWKADQSVVKALETTDLKESGLEVENWLGLLGAWSAHYFIFKWYGIAAFLIPPLLFVWGFMLAFKKQLLASARAFYFALFFTFWICILIGYLAISSDEPAAWGQLSGGIGFELALWLDSLMGWGTFILLAVSLIVFIIYYFNITELMFFRAPEPELSSAEQKQEMESSALTHDTSEEALDENEKEAPGVQAESKVKPPEWELPVKNEGMAEEEDKIHFKVPESETKPSKQDVSEPAFLIEEVKTEEKVVDKADHYDPTLDLQDYTYPTVELLKDYDVNRVHVTKEELEQNKDKIVETLTNFKIGISSIKATIGPTVTLYEIVPDAGVKISKIKNLEDDIALNLAALGIRIIAPIPGKGTIGIEVPNKNREMVSLKSVITTDRFMNSNMELPVVLGKTISNEVYVTDLTKMPHLLMAGATGQGKSVGINVILSSLLYKKHPSQLKFVLVDPKKVELTLYNTIEKHFLAKLPNNEEPIITDTKQVIYTLNSLCNEMDTRYDLLKEAGCRNLKEYNAKFIQRRLNPEKGHRFMPYIVLVIDELSDLMMTAGKEIETPIARLAQLARAIGIHLVIATQRPSVNVITGIIKANFPARLSFRVTSKVDSRTILDFGGAEQLVGMGDMLLSQGSETIRLQCAYVDTAEVKDICEYIGDQRGYEMAYELPEYIDEESENIGEVDLADRDSLFEDAARLIVIHQQGSTSLIQRKLKLGYNRAGRLIDQLEAAGIVGPFEGSKAREVLITDEQSLEQLLIDIRQKY